MAPRPATGKTPVRNLRVPDELWQPALAKAQAEGTTLTDVIKQYLTRYVSTPPKAKPAPGERPPPIEKQTTAGTTVSPSRFLPLTPEESTDA